MLSNTLKVVSLVLLSYSTLSAHFLCHDREDQEVVHAFQASRHSTEEAKNLFIDNLKQIQDAKISRFVMRFNEISKKERGAKLAELENFFYKNYDIETQIAYARELHEAAQIGDIQKIKELVIYKSVPISIKYPSQWWEWLPYSKEWTPLHVACYHNKLAAVKILTELGADINKISSNHGTPLSVAAHEDHILIVAYLLNEGADPRAGDCHRPCAVAHGESYKLIDEKVENHCFKSEELFFNVNPCNHNQFPLH